MSQHRIGAEPRSLMRDDGAMAGESRLIGAGDATGSSATWGTECRRAAARMAVAGLLLLGAALLCAGTAGADWAEASNVTLPSARFATSAVFNGTYAYVFGGELVVETSYTDEIVRYDPLNDANQTMNAKLPSARSDSSAVWDGTYAYVFGGDKGLGNTDEIVRYDPAGDSVKVMSAKLPTARYATSAVWTGTYAYVFGGQGGSYLDEIVRYDPVKDNVTVMGAELPSGRRSTSAVWTGTYAYIFGGYNGTNLDEIVQYDPANDTIKVMEAELPSGRYATSAVWDDTHAIIFGGWLTDEIVRYDAEADEVATMSAELPSRRAHTGAAWDGKRAFVFGGDGNLNVPTKEIVRYSPTPGAPANLTAKPGPGAGEIALTWDSPADNTYTAPITGYRVYRGNTTGNLSVLTDLGSTTSYADTGLPNGAKRFYKVSALNAFGEGNRSSEANATTFNVPSAPRSLTATAGPGVGQINLSWQAPADNGGTSVTNYRIYRGNTSGNLTLLTERGNVTTYKDAGLPNNATRHYQVSAVNIAGEGNRSNEANATTFNTPGAPRNLTATTGFSAGQINLTWQAPASNGGTNVTNYRIYRGNASDNLAFLTEVGIVTSYSDSGLPNNATRYYQVGAVNIVGEGSLSIEAGNTTKTLVPTAPRNLTASPGPGQGQVSLEWQPPLDDGGDAVKEYRVYGGNTSGNLTLLTELGNVTSYMDSGLPNNVTRHYQVSATNIAGEGTRSTQANATTFVATPGAPRNLSAIPGPGAGEVNLTWQAPLDDGGDAVKNYRVYRGNAGGNLSFLTELGNVTTYKDAGLPNNATRYYQVSATNGAGEGARSNEASATTFDVPSAPRNLSASAGPGVGEIRLTWQAPANDGGSNVTKYRVYRGNSSGDLSFLTELGNVTAYTDSSLPNAATRHYEVSALNAAGEGSRSNAASATTFDVPSAPRDLTADVPAQPGALELSWSPPSSDGGTSVTKYRLYRGTTSGNTAFLTNVTGTTFSDTGLDAGTTYYYRASAVNAVGEGPQGGEANATTYDVPGAPGSLEAVPGGAGEIKLAWLPPSSDGGLPVQAHRVYRGNSSGSLAFLSNATGTSFTDSGLPNNVTRYYQVGAVNAVGEGPRSNEAGATTITLPPSAPTNLDADPGPAWGEISLSWQVPASDGGDAVKHYRIYRGSSPGNLSLHSETGATTFEDSGLPHGSTWHYAASAVNAAGEGPKSPTVQATAPGPPSPPRNITALPGPLPRQIRLSWQSAVNDGGLPLLGYRLYRGTQPGGWALAAEVGPTTFAYTDAGLPTNGPWYYRAVAINGGGEGGPSNQVCTITYGAVPSGAPSLALPSEPCVAPETWTKATPLEVSQTVGGGSTPAIDKPLVQMDIAPSPGREGHVDVAIRLLGAAEPALALEQLDGKGLVQPAHVELLHLEPQRPLAGHRVTARVSYASDPSQATCMTTLVTTVCGPVRDTNWLLTSGWAAALVVEARIEDENGNTLAREVVAVPYAGQALAVLPRLP